jgi:hypothetical protein
MSLRLPARLDIRRFGSFLVTDSQIMHQIGTIWEIFPSHWNIFTSFEVGRPIHDTGFAG